MKKVVIGFLCLLFVGCIATQNTHSYSLEEHIKDYKEKQKYYPQIASLINLPIIDTICDIGGGNGISSSLLATYLPPSTIFFEEDINENFLKKSMFKYTFKMYNSPANIENFRFKLGTETSIPYATKSFNNITVFNSIHEFTDKELMLTEINRIMRDTGYLYLFENVCLDTIVKDENCGFDYLKESELDRLIDEANFNILKDTFFNKETEKDNCYTKFFICRKK